MGIKVLSCFDGISGGQQALKNLRIEVDKYYASEIDKYAIQITQKNFPNTIQLGDVTKITHASLNYDNIDLMIWGSPCTDLSISKQNRQGLEGSSSKLFFDAVRLWQEIKPKYWLMENVASMAKDAKETISKILGVEPIMINSSLVSAQQRKRLYWTNIPNITQPEDQHIYLKDIIEHGEVDRLKSYCIDASYYKGTNLETYLRKAKRQLVFEKPDRIAHLNSGGQGDRIYSTETEKEYDILDSMLAKKEGTLSYKKAIQNTKSLEDKAKTLTACGQAISNSGATNLIYCVAQRGRHINEDGKRQDILNAPTEQRFEPRFDGKTNCLTTVQKDNYICEDTNIENETSDFVIRKLTPVECERCQTFPDGHTEGVSNTQRYKALGNSFTVKVIEHILKGMSFDV